jgi:hypothetical protein
MACEPNTVGQPAGGRYDGPKCSRISHAVVLAGRGSLRLANLSITELPTTGQEAQGGGAGPQQLGVGAAQPTHFLAEFDA